MEDEFVVLEIISPTSTNNNCYNFLLFFDVKAYDSFNLKLYRVFLEKRVILF